MSFPESSLNLGGLQPIFPSGTNTRFPVLKTNNLSSHVSNILINTQLKQNLTGYKHIVTKGITHLAIPNGWSWGGPVSPNCPVWTELYLTNKSESNALWYLLLLLAIIVLIDFLFVLWAVWRVATVIIKYKCVNICLCEALRNQ